MDGCCGGGGDCIGVCKADVVGMSESVDMFDDIVVGMSCWGERQW